MKKIVILILTFFLLVLGGCGNEKKFSLSINNRKNIIIEPLLEKYSANDLVIVKTKVIEDMELGLYLDDVLVSIPKTIKEDENLYWEFSFKMPNKDAIISFHTPTEKIIYYDNEIVSVSYTISFSYTYDVDTYKEHKKFVEEKGIDTIGAKSIFYYKNSPYIFIYFSPSQDTEELKSFMNNLKEENSNIISIERSEEYAHTYVYMHNPLYYELTNNDRVEFSLVSPVWLPTGTYTSVKDIEMGLDECFKDNKDTYYNEKEEIINKTKALYNEEYFNKNILIVTPTIITGSGSNSQQLKEVYIKDNCVYMFVKMYFASMGTCDMQYTRFGVQINRDDIFDIKDDIKLEFLYKNEEIKGLW